MNKINFLKNTSLPGIAIAIVVIACLIIDFSLKNWEKQNRVIEYDVRHYYGYLPAIFIYKDIKLEKDDYRIGHYNFLIWHVTTAEGKKIIKMTMGMSMLYAPFFFVAHIFAHFSGYLENGFSEPYKLFLLLSAVFYLFVGLDYLKKILRYFKFADPHIAISILLIGLGTNLLAYSSQSAPMPHVYGFCLFAIFIYYTIKWYESQTIKNALIIGAVAGLIALIRPSNIVIVIFFVLYGITNFSDLKQRTLFFKQKILLILLMLVPVFLVWLPQFAYWKIVTGKYIYYSYNDEGFFFWHPHILDGLFSFRKGWLLYTPMMAFSLIGIFLLKDSLKKLKIAVILFLIVNIYIIFSWWCWWYGGTYGQRSLIESYALLAIPFTSFIKFIGDKRLYVRTAFYNVALFLIWLNIFQTFQFEIGSLHYDGMTKELYFKQFGKMDKIAGFDELVSSPDYGEAIKGNRENLTLIENNLATDQNSKTEENGKLIFLKAVNNKYVCADESLNNILIANRDKAANWETFSLIMMQDDKCFIKSNSNHFLSAELDDNANITALRQNKGEWETFTIIKFDNHLVAFQAANGKYISMDRSSFQLFANSDFIGEQEKFQLITLENN